MDKYRREGHLCMNYQLLVGGLTFLHGLEVSAFY